MYDVRLFLSILLFSKNPVNSHLGVQNPVNFKT